MFVGWCSSVLNLDSFLLVASCWIVSWIQFQFLISPEKWKHRSEQNCWMDGGCCLGQEHNTNYQLVVDFASSDIVVRSQRKGFLIHEDACHLCSRKKRMVPTVHLYGECAKIKYAVRLKMFHTHAVSNNKYSYRIF